MTAARVGKTLYYEPHSVQQYRDNRLARQARPNELQLYALQRATGINVHRDARHLPSTMRVQAGARPARYTTQDAAREFLTARGHRAEMVETLLRKALAMQAGKEKL